MGLCQHLKLRNPLHKLKLARKPKLGKVSVESLDGVVVLSLEHLVASNNLARLTINDVDLGEESVYFIILNHI